MFNNIDILLFSVLAGFFKATADTLQFWFNTSWFKRFKGNKYTDPSISHKNKYVFNFKGKFGNTEIGNILNYFITVFITPFSDLWHTCYTLMFITLFTMMPFYNTFELSSVPFLDNLYTLLYCAVAYGAGFEITYLTYKD